MPRPLSAALAAALVLTAALASACAGGSSGAGTPTTACKGSGTHTAYVVVQHGDGKILNACVKFSDAATNGDAVMTGSGIKVDTQSFSFGKAVCAIDSEPAHYDACFSQGAPYWGLWVEQKGGAWQQAQTSYDKVTVNDGDAIGWIYTPATASPAPPPAPKK